MDYTEWQRRILYGFQTVHAEMVCFWKGVHSIILLECSNPSSIYFALGFPQYFKWEVKFGAVARSSISEGIVSKVSKSSRAEVSTSGLSRDKRRLQRHPGTLAEGCRVLRIFS